MKFGKTATAYCSYIHSSLLLSTRVPLPERSAKYRGALIRPPSVFSTFLKLGDDVLFPSELSHGKDNFSC